MDSFTKIKILVIVGLAILGLVAVYMFATAGKDKNTQPQSSNVSMRSQQTSGFTIEEMMKQQQGQGNNYATAQNHNPFGGGTVGTVSTGEQQARQQKDAEIDALQAQLRENLNSQAQTLKKMIETNSAAEEQPSETAMPAASAFTASTKTNTNTNTNASANTKPSEQEDPIVEEKPVKPQKQQRFFSGKEQQQSLGNSTRAVVHGEQTVTSGGTLKMRLLEPLQTDDNVTVPANAFVYGTVSFAQERVQVKITSVRMDNNIYELKKDVYDRDGIKGVYVPDNIKSDIRKTATGEAIDDADVEEVVTAPSGGNILTKAIGTVGNAVKSVVGRNTQQQKVTIKTNYEIYLQ